MQNYLRMSAKVPPPLTLHICQIIVDSFGPIMFAYILNQSRGHWLLNHVINFTISMSLKFRDEIDYATFDNFMEGDGNVIYELSCLASSIKKEVVQVLDSFISFLKKHEKKKSHNMFYLMLDPKFKIFHLVFSFSDHEQGKAIVEKYEKIFVSNFVLKCYYHLHLLIEFERGVVNQTIENDNNLDIFEMTTNTSEPTTKLINKKLLIFMHY
jgi:hypothetical protein